MGVRGFFIKEEKGSEVRKSAARTRSPSVRMKSSAVIERGGEPLCETCGLYKGCLTPKMNYTGEGRLGVLIVGEAPGAEEDKQGVQFVGPVGQLLREKLKKLGLDLDRDFWKINAVNCRPPNNREPSLTEIQCCRPMVVKVIEELKPRFVWLFGGVAVKSFFMGMFSDLSISRWRRLCIPDKRYSVWVIPLFHPSYVYRNQDELVDSFYEKDLRWAVSCLDRGEPEFVDVENCVELLTGFDDVCSLLEDILRRKPVLVFDYETTGLKPYRSGHKILSVSVCFDSEKAYAFPLLYRNYWKEEEFKEIKRLWKRVLEEVPLVAHNLKFEARWSKVVLGVEPRNWIWDTMVTAHVLDCRAKFCSLKFQAFVNFGVYGYDKEIEPYRRTRGPHDFNKFEQVPLDKLLFYNAVDSLVTYWLYEKQRKELRGRLRDANKFFLKGLIALSNAEDHGIRMDENYYNRTHSELTERIKTLEKELLTSKEAQLFREKTRRPLNLKSVKDLRELFYDILKLEPVKLTAKGGPSVDHDVLVTMGNEFASKLAELRKCLKLRDTYLSQFRREIVNGKMYPTFNLHVARTYRSSSELPNFQNIPKRDKEAEKVTRSGILPSPGFRICEVDYSAIEVRIAACFTCDPVLVAYINDPNSDMHRDQAKELFIVDDNQVTKELRYYAKNGFVFPEFYGSYYKSCARNLWEEVVEGGVVTGEGITVKEHLKREGIKSYEDFERHVQEVEERFWERFKVFKQWQEDVVEFYKRKGCVEMFFGFRRSGYLSRNQIINTPIQGTAFHCLLWSLITLDEIRRKEGWRTSFMGQIHDSIVIDMDPLEQDYVLEVIHRVMCEDIRKEHPWIIVPLEIEVELAPIDRSWYEKRGAIRGKVLIGDGVEEKWIMVEDEGSGILAGIKEPRVIREGDVWRVAE